MSESLAERLQRLLRDPATQAAVRLLSKRFLDGSLAPGDLGRELDFVESHAATLQPAPEPDPEPDPRETEVSDRVKQLLSDGLDPEALRAVFDRKQAGDLAGALRLLDEAGAILKAVRDGSDDPLSLRWRGDWVAGVTYRPGDVVSFNASSYVCVAETRSQPRLFHPDWRSLTINGTGPSGPAGPAGPQGPPGEGSGDHGALTGLEDDDHPQYLTPTEHTAIDHDGLVINHDGLENVTADQHHNKSHAHDGVDGSGAVDHGSLAGLGDDDHPQYLTAAEGDAAYVNEADHTKAAHDALALSHDSLSDVSADDHHARDHSIIGATHTGFPGGTTNFLRADGTFAAPPGGGGSVTEPLISSWMGL